MKKAIKKTKKTLNPMIAIVAERMHKMIGEQVKWIEKQEKIVTDLILGVTGSGNGYDLRQSIQALETGKATLTHLKNYFQSAIEMSYDEYCEGIEVAKVMTTEERLIKNLLQYVDEAIEKKVG